MRMMSMGAASVAAQADAAAPLEHLLAEEDQKERGQ